MAVSYQAWCKFLIVENPLTNFLKFVEEKSVKFQEEVDEIIDEYANSDATFEEFMAGRGIRNDEPKLRVTKVIRSLRSTRNTTVLSETATTIDTIDEADDASVAVLERNPADVVVELSLPKSPLVEIDLNVEPQPERKTLTPPSTSAQPQPCTSAHDFESADVVVSADGVETTGSDDEDILPKSKPTFPARDQPSKNLAKDDPVVASPGKTLLESSPEPTRPVPAKTPTKPPKSSPLKRVNQSPLAKASPFHTASSPSHKQRNHLVKASTALAAASDSSHRRQSQRKLASPAASPQLARASRSRLVKASPAKQPPAKRSPIATVTKSPLRVGKTTAAATLKSPLRVGKTTTNTAAATLKSPLAKPPAPERRQTRSKVRLAKQTEASTVQQYKTPTKRAHTPTAPASAKRACYDPRPPPPPETNHLSPTIASQQKTGPRIVAPSPSGGGGGAGGALYRGPARTFLDSAPRPVERPTEAHKKEQLQARIQRDELEAQRRREEAVRQRQARLQRANEEKQRRVAAIKLAQQQAKLGTPVAVAAPSKLAQPPTKTQLPPSKTVQGSTGQIPPSKTIQGSTGQLQPPQAAVPKLKPSAPPTVVQKQPTPAAAAPQSKVKAFVAMVESSKFASEKTDVVAAPPKTFVNSSLLGTPSFAASKPLNSSIYGSASALHSTSKPKQTQQPPPPPKSPTTYPIDDIGSDDDTDNEDAPRRPIPSWAVGDRLKEALKQQFYKPVDVVGLFGRPERCVDLVEMMGEDHRRYHKRTSSAHWDDSPLRFRRSPRIPSSSKLLN